MREGTIDVTVDIGEDCGLTVDAGGNTSKVTLDFQPGTLLSVTRSIELAPNSYLTVVRGAFKELATGFTSTLWIPAMRPRHAQGSGASPITGPGITYDRSSAGRANRLCGFAPSEELPTAAERRRGVPYWGVVKVVAKNSITIQGPGAEPRTFPVS